MDLESWSRGETPLFRQSSPTVRAESVAPPARRVARFLGDGIDSDDEAGLDFAPRNLDALFDFEGVTDGPAAGTGKEDAYDPLAKLNEKGEEGEVKKTRAPRPKLDEERLLGPKGMPLLREQLNKFKIKGKGKEHEDLGRLLGLYQLWAHQMFPRSNFSDAIDTVEKLCHKRGMQRALKDWRAEYYGGRQKPQETEIDLDLPEEAAPAPLPKGPDDFYDEGDDLLDAAMAGLTSEPPIEEEYEFDEEEEAMAAMREVENASRPAPRPLETESEYDEHAMEEVARLDSARSDAPSTDALLDGLNAEDLDMDY